MLNKSAPDRVEVCVLDFFRKLRNEGCVVFLCLHPTEPYHLEILREVCERFIFIRRGTPVALSEYAVLMRDEGARAYLGALAESWS